MLETETNDCCLLFNKTQFLSYESTGFVAKFIERRPHYQRVPGSNPGEGDYFLFSHFLGHGAQSSEEKGFFSGLELVPGIPGTEIRVVSVSILLKSREMYPA